MTRNKERNPPTEITFEVACERLASVLRGGTRRQIIDAALEAGSMTGALSRLRAGMRAHYFPTATEPCNLRRLVDKFDARSRREGLHVLEGWDYRARKFPDDIVPILLLDYCSRLGIPKENERESLAILLDQYFLSLLMLLAVRAWDTGDPNANLDRVSGLLEDLHAPDGGGLRVVENADTLLLLAIAYYNPEEKSFGVWMSKVRTLDESHRMAVALPCAGIMGSHLRWGLRFMYQRDVGRMREDNVVDYPLLRFAIVVLLRAYARMCDERVAGPERDKVAEGLLNGLSADPWAFTGSIPKVLSDNLDEYEECRDLLNKYRAQLLADIEPLQPSKKSYSPLGFGANFLSNAAVATVVIALGNPNVRQQATLNALFTRERTGVLPEESAERLAVGLMRFSGAEPERLGAAGAPLIVYDQYDAVSWYNEVRRTVLDVRPQG